MSKFKSINRYNQNFKNFNFSDLTPEPDEEFLEMTIEFDANGNVVSERKFTSDGELEEENMYKYDGNGKLIEHELYYALDEAREKLVMTRNAKGKLVSEVKYYGDEPGSRTEYEYDEKDNIIGILTYDDDGEFVTKEQIEYNDKGSVTRRVTHDSKNALVSDLKFNYISDKQIEETSYDENAKPVSMTLITFNDEGKELSSVETNMQGKLISSLVNVYDDRGNVVEKIYKDFYSKRVRNEYDEHNRLISQEIFDNTGLLIKRNTYVFDEAGNVVAEQNFEMDNSRGGRDRHYGTRYEYIA